MEIKDLLFLLLTFLIGLMASLSIGYVAFKRRALSSSGFVGFLISGVSLYTFGGWAWFATMVTFFISASLWTLFRQDEKKFLDDIVEKTGPRDIWQAAANVGLASAFSLLYFIDPKPEFMAAFLGALAAPNADTWATEIGTLSKHIPRKITTLEPVPPGTSGGVTLLGTAGGIAGSILIALTGGSALYVSHQVTASWLDLVFAGTIGGIIGLLTDSILGATIQAAYFSDEFQLVTEKHIYKDVYPTVLIHGFSWINNDWINFLCSLTGATISIILFLIL